ncbi:uncharacterized protein LOC111640460 [Centruroides sculpturatus]|uniref:uncharacterized protein LOC111640460 n=1 Tax=Centruroides sculpturatus TaxID=218467 RepID=UPI000C6CB749|nr:uncharacterized protein LOC111640460 [Centruroides sculpturatus]
MSISLFVLSVLGIVCSASGQRIGENDEIVQCVSKSMSDLEMTCPELNCILDLDKLTDFVCDVDNSRIIPILLDCSLENVYNLIDTYGVCVESTFPPIRTACCFAKDMIRCMQNRVNKYDNTIDCDDKSSMASVQTIMDSFTPQTINNINSNPNILYEIARAADVSDCLKKMASGRTKA